MIKDIVVCIEYHEHLTLNKKYEVYSVRNNSMYSINNDLNIFQTFWKSRFVNLKEYRKNKLSKFLNKINE